MDLTLNDTKIQNPTLCLNMIVKNESKIIQRLFDSVLPIIDCYCICDTGSTDNTVELITEYFAVKGIPGKIVKEPFKNFCHNRNVALQHSIGMSDYVLLLDADMVLEIKNFYKTSLLNADSFFILQGNDTFYYQNMRIVKNNGLYSYCGVTHEYINTPNNNKVSGFEKNTLFIRDIGDGGAKHDKFERDIKLLLEGIQEEPNNERYHFYLANSYHDSHRFEEAINVYKKRIEFGGWREEVWYSYYRIGLCFKNMGKIDDAIKYWLEGFEFYSERLEGVYEIIKHYRINSKHKLAYLFYEQAQKIIEANLVRDSYLFLHNEVYTSKIYYEYTIFAAYVGIKNINNEVVQVLNHSFDNSETNNMLSNMKFYKDVLQQKNKLTLDNNILSVINNESIDLVSSSSCLIPKKNNDGYLMNVRYVNYQIDNIGTYLNCDKHIISVNKFVELDKNFNFITEKWMNIKFDNRRYVGIEDVRIFNDIETDQLLFIGTGFHQNNKIGIVNGIYGIDNGSLEEKEIVPDFTNSECEKNWEFVDYNGSTHIIYNWYPVQICKMNENKDVLSRVDIKSTPKLFSYIRGSTSGFKYASKTNIIEYEIWFVNHIVSYESPRHYYHIISVFDENMNLLRYSAPFKFEGEPIEYCLSIVVEDERVLINYSTWDRTTRIGIYDKKYIDSIVKYNVKYNVESNIDSNIDSMVKHNMTNCIVFEDGILINNSIDDCCIWDGLFSKVKSNGNLIKYIGSCLPKNTVFVIPKSDGNINRNTNDSKYHDVNWNKQIQPYLDYAKQNNKVFIIGTLCQIDEEKDCKYLYLPLDDDIFEYGIEYFFNKTNLPLWENRSSQLCWMGGCSGIGNLESLRVSFVKKIYDYDPNSKVRLSTWWSENKNIPIHYFSDRIHYTEFTKYKIFFIVDGAVIASNHMYGFATGCIPFIISNGTCWYSHLSQPYVHYIHVNYDLSNLIEQIEWVKNNDSEAKKISENAYKFAETYFSVEYQQKYIKESIEKFVSS